MRKVESDEEEEVQLSAAATPTQTRSRRKITALQSCAVEPVAADEPVAAAVAEPSRRAGSRRKIEDDEEEEAQLSAAATPTQTRTRRKIAALESSLLESSLPTAVEPVAAAVGVAFQPSAAVVADEPVIESSAVDTSSTIVAGVALHEKLLVYDVKVCCMYIS
jgi:hypothetical protein